MINAKEQTMGKIIIILMVGIILGLMLGMIFDFITSNKNSPRIDNSSSEYQRGVSRGIKIAENQYEPMLEQYQPTGDYFICVLGNGNMKFIFNDTKAYEEIKNLK